MQRWISNVHIHLHPATVTQQWWQKTHCFLSKVRLQLSSGSLKWTLTSQEFTAESLHHLLLPEVAREPNLWMLASSVPTAKELRQLSETSRAEWHKQPSSSNNQHSARDVTCHRHPNNDRKAAVPSGLGRGDWKSPRISAVAKKTFANPKMQQWSRAAA